VGDGPVVAVAAGGGRGRADRRPADGGAVPFADGSGAKVRPCLVLLNRRRGITVLKITSQDKSRRRDYLRIPTRSWDRRASHDSYLNLSEPVVVPRGAFERRAGPCDEVTLKVLHTQPALRPSALRRPRRSADRG
jgi:hypothetical protein